MSDWHWISGLKGQKHDCGYDAFWSFRPFFFPCCILNYPKHCHYQATICGGFFIIFTPIMSVLLPVWTFLFIFAVEIEEKKILMTTTYIFIVLSSAVAVFAVLWNRTNGKNYKTMKTFLHYLFCFCSRSWQRRKTFNYTMPTTSPMWMTSTPLPWDEEDDDFEWDQL